MSNQAAPAEPRLPGDLFSPRSIAILGASSDPSKLGYRPLDYLRRHGYAGTVYPINPNRTEILGWPCAPSLEQAPGPVDCALISLPAAIVPDAYQSCVRQGVRLAVVLTAGVEVPPPPELLVMGPNSMGVLNAPARIAATWSSSLDLAELRPGRVGLISQSGGLGGSVLNRLQDKGVGLSYAFWTGNELSIDSCHLIRFLLDDPVTSVIVLLAEGFRRPRRFLELAELALERGKPIIVLKMARAPGSSALTVAHTGILAGSASSYSAAFRQHGVVEASGLDDLVDTTMLFARTPLTNGDGLAVISSSGGVTVLVSDLCQEQGIRLPALESATLDRLRSLVPPYAPEPGNPLDITAGLSEKVLFDCLEQMAADPKIDLVLNVATMLGGAARMRARAEGLVEARQRIGVPIVSCWTGGSLADAGLSLCAQADLPYYTSPERCLRGIRAFFDYAALLREREPLARPAELQAAAEWVRAELRRYQAAETRILTERESLPLLEAYGLPMVESRAADSPSAAVAAARELGYPVVLKADVAGLAHKSRLGGVRLDLPDDLAVTGAYAAIHAAIERAGLASRWRGVLVQPRAEPGLEAVLGVSRDAQFGPRVLAGLGGVHVETLGQAAVRLAPLRPRDARELLDASPLRAIQPREALIDAALRLGWLAADCADLLAECDLNPLRILASGRLLALDALLVLA